MSEVARPKGVNDTQISLLLPGDWIDEIEQLAKGLSPPGVTVTRADALRAVVRAGIDALSKAKKR